ncbi:Phage Tail Collar Domain protein [compost metagenome]
MGGMVAKGQLLPIQLYAPLFSLIGNTFGGDGTTNFALPNLTGQAPANLTYMICTEGLYPSRI